MRKPQPKRPGDPNQSFEAAVSGRPASAFIAEPHHRATRDHYLRYRAGANGQLNRLLIWSRIVVPGACEVSVMALVVAVVFGLGVVLLGSLMLTDRRTNSF